VALTTHDRPRFVFKVAALTKVVIRLHKGSGWKPGLNVVAIRTAHVFARFAFHLYSILIQMMTDTAFVDLCLFIVFIVNKNSCSSLSVIKRAIRGSPVLIRKGRYGNQSKKAQTGDDAQYRDEFSHYKKPPQLTYQQAD
jgi:hypothetical protein